MEEDIDLCNLYIGNKAHAHAILQNVKGYFLPDLHCRAFTADFIKGLFIGDLFVLQLRDVQHLETKIYGKYTRSLLIKEINKALAE